MGFRNHVTVIKWYKFLRGFCNKFLLNDPIFSGKKKKQSQDRKTGRWEQKTHLKFYFKNNINS